MGLQEDVQKNIDEIAARSRTSEQNKGKEAPKGEQRLEYREIETIGPDGKSTVKQVVEKHSGLHTAEESEKILGKRKTVPQLRRGVVYDADGHPVALGGSSSGESRLEKM